MRSFEEDLSRAIAFHGHLCGGQLTGVRMARYALKYFGIEDPDHYRDLIVYVECDRCLTDAIMVVTGCHPGKRRMKCLDFGNNAPNRIEQRNGFNFKRLNMRKHAIKCFFDAHHFIGVHKNPFVRGFQKEMGKDLWLQQPAIVTALC